MRIIETVYKVEGSKGEYEVKMTQVKGLKVRELVHVRRLTAKATNELPCSSENTPIR